MNARRGLGTIVIVGIALLGVLALGLITRWGPPATWEAQAARQALEAADESAARQVELEALMRGLSIDLQSRQDASWSLIAREALWNLGLGVGGLLASIGAGLAMCAFAIWLFVRPQHVYADKTTRMFPLIKLSGWGTQALIDPNRAAGPVQALQLPTVVDEIARLLGRPNSPSLRTLIAPPDAATAVALNGQALTPAVIAASALPGTREPRPLRPDVTWDVSGSMGSRASTVPALPAPQPMEASHLDLLLAAGHLQHPLRDEEQGGAP